MKNNRRSKTKKKKEKNAQYHYNYSSFKDFSQNNDSSHENFNQPKTGENPLNLNSQKTTYFLLKSSRISNSKQEKKQNFNSVQLPKEKYQTNKYVFRNHSEFPSSENNKKKTISSFFLKNDSLQLSNRVFLSQKLQKIDKKLMDLMIKLSKNISFNENKSGYSFLQYENKKNPEPTTVKNDFYVDKPVEEEESPLILKKKMVYSPNNNPTKKFSISEKERQEKINQILNRKINYKLNDIPKNVKPKNEGNKKKVAFNV